MPTDSSTNTATAVERITAKINAMLDLVSDWYSALQWLLLGCLLLTTLVTGLTTIAGIVSNKRQSDQIAVLNSRTEQLRRSNITLQKQSDEQRERAAKAERDLELLKETRAIDKRRASEILSKTHERPREIVIEWVAASREATEFCKAVGDSLVANGWPNHPMGPNEGFVGVVPAGVHLRVQYGNKDFTTASAEDLEEPARTLHRFFSEAVKGNPAVTTHVMPLSPDGSTSGQIDIWVGARY